jgi:DNA-directed RNA polymerase specialized sigma24 family protein
MTTDVECRTPKKQKRSLGSASLDEAASRSRVPGMTVEEELRSQDWARIRKQLTNFAWRFTGRRSWENAEDLAQHAIADAYARRDGWDPAKEPLIGNLIRRVRGLVSNEWRRKRNAFEVAMGITFQARDGEGDDEDSNLDFASGEDAPDEVLDRRRLAKSYREGISQRILGDDVAMAVVALWLDGVTTPAEQAARSGFSEAQIAAARRRVFYHAGQVSKELGLALDSEDAEDGKAEVSP